MMELFNKIVSQLGLGELINDPLQISGGLTHRMFKLETNTGKYIVKLLNPNIMKRPTAMDNFLIAERFEKVFESYNIPAIYAMEFNETKMQLIDDQYYYVFKWSDGKSLKDADITIKHCEIIGRLLSNIHNIDLIEGQNSPQEKNINWEYYINKAKEENYEIYNMIYDKLDILNESMEKGNESYSRIPKVSALCHNDMDSKNVLWVNDECELIDLECLGYSNPYLELYELALCWSGYESCNIDFKKFKTFMKSYFENSNLNPNIDWEAIYYSNNGRLEWLEYNLKRALRIECSSEEEYNIGMNEVKETLEHLVYYDKVKKEILDNI